MNGAFFASTGSGDGSFDAAYMKRFGKRARLGGIGAYDLVGLLAAAFKEGSGDRRRVNDYLHATGDFQGKLGVYGPRGDNSFDAPVSICKISDGVVVKKVIE